VSNSGSIQVRAIREVTPGTLPAGAMLVVPFETMPFKSSFTRGQPGDVNTHGQSEDNPAENLSTSATGAGDFRFGIRDLLREEAFRSTVTSSVSISSALIAAVASGNKLTRAAGWGSLAAGDIVWITGFATNAAAFAAKISAVSSGDLTLAWPTVVDESAGPTVVVAHLGQLTVGTSLLTSYWEEWNLKSLKGRQFPGLSATGWDVMVDDPSHWKESFPIVGMQAASRLSAQLANATTAATSRKIFNGNTNTGDKTVAGSQMGFRYNGALMTDLIIKSLKFNLTSPKLTETGVGTLGPQSIALDGLFEVKIDLKVLRSGANVDTLMDDAADPNAEKSFGIGLRDGDGKRVYLWVPKAQPMGGDPDGLKRSGSEMVDFSYVARYESVDSSIRYAMLT
jgi:hypothetical protein